MNIDRSAPGTRGPAVRIFVDFDGTITVRDVGDSLFEEFGGARCTEYVRRYQDGEISAEQCFILECAACADVPRAKLDAFIDSQEIDLSFPSFADFCRREGMECVILSDGMDYYIRRILDRHGCTVPSFSNSLTLVPVDDGSVVRFFPSFPYTEESCDRCACCKRNHILTMCADDDIIVYVGEGYSDRCPARFADIVFAKDHLLEYCREESIPCFEYASFADVRVRLETLLRDRTARKAGLLRRKRRQAQIACRDVFLGG